MAEKMTFSDYNCHVIRHWAHKTLPLHTAAIKRDPGGPFHRRSSDMIYVDVAGKLPQLHHKRWEYFGWGINRISLWFHIPCGSQPPWCCPLFSCPMTIFSKFIPQCLLCCINRHNVWPTGYEQRDVEVMAVRLLGRKEKLWKMMKCSGFPYWLTHLCQLTVLQQVAQRWQNKYRQAVVRPVELVSFSPHNTSKVI